LPLIDARLSLFTFIFASLTGSSRAGQSARHPPPARSASTSASDRKGKALPAPTAASASTPPLPIPHGQACTANPENGGSLQRTAWYQTATNSSSPP